MKAVVLGSAAGGGFPKWNCRLSYFTARPEQASRDVESALAYVTAHAPTPADQEAVVAALEFKCDVLWAMLHALDHAYGEPGQIPPGALSLNRDRYRIETAARGRHAHLGGSRPRRA